MSEIHQDFSPAGMTAAIDANVVGTTSSFGRVPGTELRGEDPDLRFIVSPAVPFPLFNQVHSTRLQGNADARIEEVFRQYAAHELPFAWSVGPLSSPPDLGPRLRSRGLRPFYRLPGMAAGLDAVEWDVPLPAGLTVERVRDAGAAKEYAGVMRTGFEMPGFIDDALFRVLTSLGFAEDAPFVHYVGRLDGEMLATASLSLAAGVAGVFNVTTLHGARRRGIGTALTLAALRDARERGYRVCILQSSEMALDVYRRLGFGRYGDYVVYVWTGQ